MELITSSASVRIFNKEDIVTEKEGVCLKNQSYAFQVVIDGEEPSVEKVRVESDLGAKIYQVLKVKGDSNIPQKDKRTDCFYVDAEDEMYPELTREIDTVSVVNGITVLFIEIPATEKTAGKHTVTVKVGECKIEFCLTVIDKQLDEQDKIVTNWFHSDGICRIYNVEPFSERYYTVFDNFLDAYVKCGNNAVLVPLFTPPLDTEKGSERLTTQLIDVIKSGNNYSFSFEKLKKYLDACRAKGIKYFELSHLYTQWGGEFCPKIMAVENGEYKKIFGWENSSESTEYQEFLSQFLPKLVEFLKAERIKENCFVHITDEPNTDHTERYTRLVAFTKKYIDGIKTLDALSHYDVVKNSKLDLPVVCTGSSELDKFADLPHMLYYCVNVDGNCLSNRYFHMPILRTEIVGFQMYDSGAQGFLQWGYNFYNTVLSKAPADPYTETTCGGGLPAGDAFIVYPGRNGVEYSIRYFALLRAFEDWRLLQTVEKKTGRENVLKTLRDHGISGVFAYPHDVKELKKLRETFYSLL